MKVQPKHAGWGLAGALLLGSVFTLIAWTGNPKQQQQGIATQTQDTVPSKQRQKVTRQPNDRDFDYELRQLDHAGIELADVDWEKISRDVENALKDINFEKIQLQVQESMKNVDLDKISKQVEESLKSIDFDKIEKDIASSKYIDKEEIKKELKEAREQVEKELKNADWKKEIENAKKLNKEELDRELDNAKKEIEKAKEELKAEKFNFKEEMKKAGVEIEKAKEELKGYQEMVYAMEKDGLLSTKEDYTIIYKKGELKINGKVQPAEVTNKYKKYFKRDVTIEKESGDIDIDHGNSKDHIDI